MTLSKKHKLKEIYPLIDTVVRMYDKEGFCISSLRRKFSPILKTTQLQNSFTLHDKKSGRGVSCVFEPLEDGQTFIRVRYNKTYSGVHFDLFVTSNKEF